MPYNLVMSGVLHKAKMRNIYTIVTVTPQAVWHYRIIFIIFLFSFLFHIFFYYVI
ncbi:hypothetical protein H1P_960003 [Hyella patelloides LEGE 07179]|uniref:Uncharacterized protein n=1 Tax=Hyella patelloides LEGE 07179 TaxID=945734 RepID=A0A563W5D4_9CYAN|nr:hypothetical protein H1P_960003 [Hyella patelloides LEGE 07179]